MIDGRLAARRSGADLGRAVAGAVLRAPSVWVALVAAVLYLPGLGTVPWLDPPEGFHAEIAREMGASGDWVTPHLNGVRYFSKPPLPYWLMSATFAMLGPSPFAARLWSALAGIATAAVTARLGALLGGPRLGLLAGLMVTANLGTFVFARIVKPDLLLVLFVSLAFTGFALACVEGRRIGLVVFYGSLGLAVLAKDVLGGLGPLGVTAIFLWLAGERKPWRWIPWWGAGLFVVVALPWYLAMEARNTGFLRHTIFEVHLLNFAGWRVFPDEDVPLTALEFLLVTAVAFLPWSLAAPGALVGTLRGSWTDARARLWGLLGLWPVAVIGLFAISRFKLPHYGLPAFPALALLAARAWDEAIARAPAAPRLRPLLLPALLLFALATGGFVLASADLVRLPDSVLETADVATRNFAAGGQRPAFGVEVFRPLYVPLALVLGGGTVALAVATQRRAPRLGAGALLLAMVALLPVIGQGLGRFAESRSVRPIAEVLARAARPADLVVHEGPLENSGSLLLGRTGPVPIVNGLRSTLAVGATFPDAREIFWDLARLSEAWTTRRVWLVSVLSPEESVVRDLAPVYRVGGAGNRWLYTNVPPGGRPGAPVDER